MEGDSLIGAIPPEWKVATLGEACSAAGGEIQTGPFGSQLHAADYVDDGIPSIMPQNIGDNRVVEDGIARITHVDAERLARYLVKKGDIVYSRRGDVERRALIRDREQGWLCGTGCLRVRLGDKDNDSVYASYYLGHPAVREWIVRHAHGATMPNLNTAILSDLPFVVPPLPEQKAIAHILGTLDDKIELNRKMNETLEAMARAMFKSWFVDFDPVHAKVKGKKPDGMDSETAALFPTSFVDSELGKIPKGWKAQVVSDFIELTGGGTPKTAVVEYWNGDIPWFSVVDAPAETDVYAIDTEKHITETAVKWSATRMLRQGTTIISARGTVGKLALVGNEMAMNQSCYGINGANKRGDLFTYYLIRLMVEALQRSAHGSVFDTITRDTFKTISHVASPVELTVAYDEVARPHFDRILQNLFQNRLLTRTRDALLPKLLSGEIRIKDAETFVEVA